MKNLQNALLRKKLNFKSVEDLNNDILGNIVKLRVRYDLIIGVPRSGMLPATLLSLYLNCDLTDLYSFLRGEIYPRGNSRKTLSIGNIGNYSNILVLDDSLFSGNELNRVKGLLSKHSLGGNIHYGVVYISPEKTSLVDVYFEKVDNPRIFEWNLFHSKVLENACVDIDGVLCRDPNESENDDGAAYRQFISNVEPMILPTVKIGYLVTNRLEKYRVETEAWLKKHKIDYNSLYMRELESKADRIRIGKHGEFKADISKKVSANLFIESSISQAKTIVNNSCIDVFCTENWKMYHPSNFNETVNSFSYVPQQGIKLIKYKLLNLIQNIKLNKRNI
jgi:orotate phosphoribosyltransferase